MFQEGFCGSKADGAFKTPVIFDIFYFALSSITSSLWGFKEVQSLADDRELEVVPTIGSPG